MGRRLKRSEQVAKKDKELWNADPTRWDYVSMRRHLEKTTPSSVNFFMNVFDWDEGQYEQALDRCQTSLEKNGISFTEGRLPSPGAQRLKAEVYMIENYREIFSAPWLESGNQMSWWVDGMTLESREGCGDEKFGSVHTVTSLFQSHTWTIKKHRSAKSKRDDDREDSSTKRQRQKSPSPPPGSSHSIASQKRPRFDSTPRDLGQDVETIDIAARVCPSPVPKNDLMINLVTVEAKGQTLVLSVERYEYQELLVKNKSKLDGTIVCEFLQPRSTAGLNMYRFHGDNIWSVRTHSALSAAIRDLYSKIDTRVDNSSINLYYAASKSVMGKLPKEYTVPWDQYMPQELRIPVKVVRRPDSTLISQITVESEDEFVDEIDEDLDA